jgi:hypothetical protein
VALKSIEHLRSALSFYLLHCFGSFTLPLTSGAEVYRRSFQCLTAHHST